MAQEQGREIKTSQGSVVIPMKYMEDPSLYQGDLRGPGVDPRLKTVEVQKFLADRLIDKMKQNKVTGNGE